MRAQPRRILSARPPGSPRSPLLEILFANCKVLLTSFLPWHKSFAAASRRTFFAHRLSPLLSQEQRPSSRASFPASSRRWSYRVGLPHELLESACKKATVSHGVAPVDDGGG